MRKPGPLQYWWKMAAARRYPATQTLTEAVIYAGLAAVKTGGVWRTPVLLGSGSPASDSGASGDAAYTLLPGAPTWNKTSFSTVYNVAAAPGIAVAAVKPQVSVSTASVP